MTRCPKAQGTAHDQVTRQKMFLADLCAHTAAFGRPGGQTQVTQWKQCQCLWNASFCGTPSVRYGVAGIAEPVRKQDALTCHSQALGVTEPVRQGEWSSSAATTHLSFCRADSVGWSNSAGITHLSFCRAHSVGRSMPGLLALLREEAPDGTLQCTLITQGGLGELL